MVHTKFIFFKFRFMRDKNGVGFRRLVETSSYLEDREKMTHFIIMVSYRAQRERAKRKFVSESDTWHADTS